MEQELDNLSYEELKELLLKYDNEKKKIALLVSKKYKETMQLNLDDLMAQINEDIIKSKDNKRLNSYLENKSIKDIDFLFRNMTFMNSCNYGGRIPRERLIFFDKTGKEILRQYKINDRMKLTDIFIDYSVYKKEHPILKDQTFTDLWLRSSKLIYLDEFFKDSENVLNFQGTYTTYMYVKEHIKKSLDASSLGDDNELVYKNYNEKINFAKENLKDITFELVNLRDSIPGAKVAINNIGLSKTAHKKEGSNLTKSQENLVEAIAFGSSLDKLKEHDYSEIKKLIYVPIRKNNM